MAINLLKRGRTLPLGQITSTGHTVGVTYACHDTATNPRTYRVIGRGEIFPHAARVQWCDNSKILDRLRSLRQSDDHPVSVRCPQNICRLRLNGEKRDG
jgi:hypothetical protein